MRRIVLGLALGASFAGAQQQAGTSIQYPTTRKVDTVTSYFGTRVADPFRWMEDIETPEVAEWVKAQNAITMPYLASLQGRDLFQTRITALYNYARTGLPFYEGGRWFYSRNTGLQRQNVWFTRKTLDASEQLVLDPNQLSPDGSTALSGFAPSPDGKWLAYGQSEGGSDWVTYYVRDLATGRNTSDTVRWVKFGGASWTTDGKGFFYSRYPEPPKGEALKVKLENQTLYYHRVGTPQSKDVKVYARPDQPTWFVFGGVDETGRYLFVSTAKGTDKNEVYMADLRDPKQPDLSARILPVVTGHDANYNPLGVANGKLYLQVDKDAPNRKIVAAPASNPSPGNWTTIIPEADLPIEGAGLVAGKIGVLSLQDVASVVRLYSLDGKLERDVPMPGLGSASGLVGRFDRPELFFSFSSPTVPATVYSYDAASNSSKPFNPPKLTFDPSQFVTERVFYSSKDGTRVPMFVTHRKDMAKDGNNPAMLYAYGGFAITSTPTFSASVIAWIEQGGVYALANLRGGGEYGERWHEAGKFEKKQNVFDDFIAAAEYLVREKYTSPNHLAINGGSNGGLLVGAVMTQRPDLFAAAIPQVGVMDMLRYDLFTGGAAWAAEYGSAKDSVAFQYLRAYSPLQNIKSGVCYPATLVTTADHDDRVVPSHSFKFAATMQPGQAATAGCTKPVLIRVEAQGSHGYRPLDRRIKESADIWAFAAQHTGMVVKPSPVTP
ncbi:MAG TPA: prolyl oligopeptidase family serine peptidase [Gemmatimonadaceae bacterium]|nr:prolyl oligopeptidase family serine peptidase [Gemmatimonadaceae bacterium]